MEDLMDTSMRLDQYLESNVYNIINNDNEMLLITLLWPKHICQ